MSEWIPKKGDRVANTDPAVVHGVVEKVVVYVRLDGAQGPAIPYPIEDVVSENEGLGPEDK